MRFGLSRTFCVSEFGLSPLQIWLREQNSSRRSGAAGIHSGLSRTYVSDFSALRENPNETPSKPESITASMSFVYRALCIAVLIATASAQSTTSTGGSYTSIVAQGASTLVPLFRVRIEHYLHSSAVHVGIAVFLPTGKCYDCSYLCFIDCHVFC